MDINIRGNIHKYVIESTIDILPSVLYNNKAWDLLKQTISVSSSLLYVLAWLAILLSPTYTSYPDRNSQHVELE